MFSEARVSCGGSTHRRHPGGRVLSPFVDSPDSWGLKRHVTSIVGAGLSPQDTVLHQINSIVLCLPRFLLQDV